MNQGRYPNNNRNNPMDRRVSVKPMMSNASMGNQTVGSGGSNQGKYFVNDNFDFSHASGSHSGGKYQ